MKKRHLSLLKELIKGDELIPTFFSLEYPNQKEFSEIDGNFFDWKEIEVEKVVWYTKTTNNRETQFLAPMVKIEGHTLKYNADIISSYLKDKAL